MLILIFAATVSIILSFIADKRKTLEGIKRGLIT
jgi:hypothetical protein